VPADPVIEVRGEVELDLPLAELSAMPRKEITADFHCVAGWSATDLRWEGVPFAAFYRALVEPALPPDTAITHVRCRGLDGVEAVVTIEDILSDDVLIAQNLDGQPLGSDHGAPVRLVSPSQYGYISVKHLCRVEVLTAAPVVKESPLLRTHPRARVWEEERHGFVPGRVVRPIYRALIRPIRILSARGASDRHPVEPPSR
jgi:DMSO/TMAO reductase YedYZ molybdopterin-dependent catalytic subunit